MAQFLEPNYLSKSHKHGFDKGFSCKSQVVVFTRDIHLNRDVSMHTDTSFLDFTKATDKISRAHLMLKLMLKFVLANNHSSTLPLPRQEFHRELF